MAVIVVGASGLIGRALVPALVDRDPHVRAVVRRAEDAEPLRRLGAKVTVRDPTDAEALSEVCGGIDTLIHLVGGPNQPDEDELLRANHGSVLGALAAARERSIRRFVLVSVPGASPEAAHPFIRAKGLAEEAMANAGLDHLIVRTAHVYGVGGLWFAAAVQGAVAEPPFVVGEGTQEVAPVFVDDVAAALAAAHDVHEPVVGTFGLEGPDVVTADELASILGDGRTPVGVSGEEAAARLTAALAIPVSRAAAEWLGMPSRADAPDAAHALGVRRTPLADGLRTTLARGAAG